MSSSTLDRPATVLRPLDLSRLVGTGGVPRLISRPSVRLVVCHPAALAAQAVAAALRPGDRVEDVTVVGSATDLVRESGRHFDLALVSETLGADLPELLQALAFRGALLPVVVMTTDDDPDLAAQYLEWGAAGSVDTRRPVSALLEAMLVATTGGPVVEPGARADVLAHLDARAAHRAAARALLASLSLRERRVIESLAGGTGVADIARTLHLSPHTIRACISGLGPKLEVAGQLRIAALARELLAVAHEPAHSRYLFALRTAAGSRLPLSG